MKILIIRFSSIGDIVLTSPLLRVLAESLPNAELHFLVKEKFEEVVRHNPYLKRIISFKRNARECITELRRERYDLVLDLQHNMRSAFVKIALGVRSTSFKKLNIKKWVFVHFKRNLMPHTHIVDRYFATARALPIKNDGKGLDFFHGEEGKMDLSALGLEMGKYHILVAGGSYFTKRIPIEKMKEIIRQTNLKMVIVGGLDDIAAGNAMEGIFPGKVISLCGKTTLLQSAYIIKNADSVVTGDTGLMHIAAAYKKRIFSIWGNTLPEFGMYPYLPGVDSQIIENKNLKCRPCSKLGHHKCPEKHFKCMQDLDFSNLFLKVSNL